MPTSVTAMKSRDVNKKKEASARPFLWQGMLVYLTALVLLGIGLWMRLRDLGLPFDRDGYDEGVYWQSLRAMSSRYHLYQQIFYSQPPFFLLSVFPTYMLLGHTLWAARLGVALVSLLGLVGAFLFGKAVGGNLAALAALLLLIMDPLYLAQSQTLQAEAPYAAFSLLAVGFAYLWWKHPEGKQGISYAACAGATLSLSILCKFFGFATLVPVGLLLLARIWHIYHQEPEKRFSSMLSALVGILAFLVVTALVLVPFAGSWHAMLQGIVTFHTAASKVYKYTQHDNLSKIAHALLSPLAFVALYGTLTALLRKNWLMLPLLAWFGATAILLWSQVPLFPHHFVAFTPPLVTLAAIGIGPIQLTKKFVPSLSHILSGIAVLAVLLGTVADWVAVRQYYHTELARSMDISVVQYDANVERDLQQVTQPDQLVITDAQFLAALADRNTDPLLVDTSQVRVDTGYLTTEQLIAEAAQPQVRAVLFYSGRLARLKNITFFYAWLQQHFRLIHRYSPGKELWVKVS